VSSKSSKKKTSSKSSKKTCSKLKQLMN
jgi:hypothetical protein